MTTSKQFQIDPNVHAAIIANLRQRATRLRRYSVIIIVLIVLVLAAGISIFILAGRIVNRESNQGLLKEKRDKVNDVIAEIIKTTDDITVLKGDLRNWESKYEYEFTRERRGVKENEPLIDYFRNKIDETQKPITEHENRLRELFQQRSSLRAELIEMEAAASENTSVSQNQIFVLVSAFATRVGAVVLLLFLVQILVPLYRYNMKLSSYYDARADALTIISTSHSEGAAWSNGADGAVGPVPARTSVDTLERLVAALSPDGIDFGKAPTPPSEHALRFAKDVITSQRK
jgi:hypothetical protein